MRALRPVRSAATTLLAAGWLALGSPALAQLEPVDEGLNIGDWTFYPSLQVRVRGEYRHHPMDVGGDQYVRNAVLADGYLSAAPNIRERVPAVDELLWVSERARLGLRVQWNVLTAAVILQDARVLGRVPTADGSANLGTGEFDAYEMYLDVRDSEQTPMLELRLGRQRLRWGDGRLLGANEWLTRGGALDAGRLQVHIDGVTMEVLAVLLALPTELPADYETKAPLEDLPVGSGLGGAQLFGLRADWRIMPLLNAELAALARIARAPLPAQLMPSDSYTLDARLYGEKRGFRYAAEGALQLGRVTGYGANRDILAFAAAAYADWQTALPWQLRFRLDGAYASGDDSNGQGDSFGRFDPLLPEVHDQHGQMDLYSWSNIIEGAASLFATPMDEVELGARYALVGLAEPNDRLSSAALIAIGAAPDNDSRLLGHEIDLRLNVTPWRSLHLGAGYGLMLLGDGGKNMLESSGRGGGGAVHHGYLQAELSVPAATP